MRDDDYPAGLNWNGQSWKRHPEADGFVRFLVGDMCEDSPVLKRFRAELMNRAGLNVLDVVDHLVLRGSEPRETLHGFGYQLECTGSSGAVYYHPGADLPRILVESPYESKTRKISGIALRCDSVVQAVEALTALGFKVGYIEGTPGGRLARVRLPGTEEVLRIWFVERRATRAMGYIHEDPGFMDQLEKARSLWRARDRWCRECKEAHFGEELLRLSGRVKELVPVDLAAALFLEVERDYWQSRNMAARRQKDRLDGLGLGWASRDHHTFRCSRAAFKATINFFESLGFRRRERFDAGDSAGWGAQVLENHVEGAVIFVDVDLLPGEQSIDYAREDLPPAPKLGVIGRWCALHGMSVANAGLHHLEIKCAFEACRAIELASGFGVMEPFNESPELHQAFTAAERWPVKEYCLLSLVKAGKITAEEAEQIRQNEAPGSHLEHLERAWGYKGFSKESVSRAIHSTEELGPKP